MSQLELQVFSREDKEQAVRLVRKTVDRVNYQQGIFLQMVHLIQKIRGRPMLISATKP